ncbi:MFS transporter [Rhizobium leguminosarum]|nr:MFS transporter [Rhizobium leguminosarum]
MRHFVPIGDKTVMPWWKSSNKHTHWLWERPRLFVTLAAMIVANGMTKSVLQPYLPVLAVDHMGISVTNFGILVVVSALVSTVLTVYFGYLADKVRSKKGLIVIASCVGAVAYGATWVSGNIIVFVLLVTLFIPLSVSVFYQIFSLSRHLYLGAGKEAANNASIALRGAFTLSWIVGPPISGIVADRMGISTTLAISMFAAALCASIGIAGLPKENTRSSEKTAMERPTEGFALAYVKNARVIYGVIAICLIEAALQTHSMMLGMFMTRQLSNTVASIGIVYGILACLEILMLPLVLMLSRRVKLEYALSLYCIMYATYLSLIGDTTSFYSICLLQILNAAAISGLYGLMIVWSQNLIEERPGLSTSLYAVAEIVGATIASAIFASTASHNLFRAGFWSAAGLCLIAALLTAGAPVLMRRPSPR